MRKILFTLLTLLVLAAPAAAQVTVPHIVADGETIDAARINANFAVFANALNRTGGTMTGTLTSQQITPSTTNTYDLGVTGTRFRHLWLSGDATVGGALAAGATTITGTLTTQHITPSAHNTYDLGVTGTRFRDLWLSRDATVGGNLDVGGSVEVLTTTGNGIGSGGSASTGLAVGLNATAASGAAYGMRLFGGTLTAVANGDALIYFNVGNFADIAKGTFTGLLADVARFSADMTQSGTGTIAEATTVRIMGAPSVGTNNYALRIAGGDINFNGARLLSGSTQPGFLAYNSATDASQANNATIDFDTEVYDEAGNFSADTFTAPVTGRYLLCTTISGSGPSSSPVQMGPKIVTSNRTYVLTNYDMVSGTTRSGGGCVIADMDASDTATVQLNLGSGTIGIIGTSSPDTSFMGRLVP